MPLKFYPQARFGGWTKNDVSPSRGALREHLDQITEWPEERREAARFKRPEWAEFAAFQAEDNSTAELHVYDVIGTWDLNAATFRDALNSITAPQLTVKINSPGGSVFDGFAMFEDLRQHKARVRVEVTGLAASAASLLAMAGDEIAIAENGFMMIHEAWSVAIGSKRDMAKTNRLLGQIDKRLAKTYAVRTGADLDAVADMMDDETWFDSEDAVEAGFADSIIDAVDPKALAHDFYGFIKTPDAIKAASRQTAKTTATPEAPALGEQENYAELFDAVRRLENALKGNSPNEPARTNEAVANSAS